MSTTLFNHSSDTLQAEKLGKPVVLLSVKRKENQRLIQHFLPDDYSVFISPEKINGEPFDISIIDEFSIRNNLKTLRQIKKTKAPEFLPVMLLTSENSVLSKSQQIWDFVDDILSMPVSTGIFNSRIATLLKSRSYSLALKEKNERLEEQKNKYQLIAENSTDMITRHAPDGTYLYASPASEQLMGYTPDELEGRNAYEFFHPDDIPAIRENHRAFSGNGITSATYRIATKDSGYKWVETHSRLMWGKQNDELVEIQASTRDISERKAYEQQLTQEKELLNITIDSLPGIFYMLDSEMNLVRWNSNFSDELGYTNEEIEQKDYREFFTDTAYDKLDKKIRKVWTSGYTDMEIDLLDSQGKAHRYFLVARTMVIDDRMYLVGSGVDISDRVKAEHELEQSIKRWEMLVQKNPGLVMLTTEDKEIKFINPAGTQFLGKEDQDELIGTYWTDFVRFENEELVNKQINAALAGDRVESTTFKVFTHDGRELYVDLQKVPVEYQNQSVILTVGQDVTQRIKYKHELENSLEEKKILLQEIHHRVKNNLAIVSGLLELQSERIENSEVRELLTKSQNRIHSIAKVHELLYQNNELNRIDFKSYILELAKTLGTFTHNEEINIEYQYDLDEVTLNIDQAVSCGMVINELITNAVKHAFRDQYKGLIGIALSQDGDQVTIEITDNGSGLPESFDLNSRKTFGKTIIRLLVDQLQAELEFNQEGDTGTTFKLTFTKREYSGPSKKF